MASQTDEGSTQSSEDADPPRAGRNGDDPASERSRLLPSEIFARVKVEGETELRRPWFALASSGFGAGLMMGLSALGVATLASLLGRSDQAHVVASALYPLGFITVVLGRSLLFTENTLYPVVVVLEERRGVLATLRLWSIILAANVAGATLFAYVMARTSAIPGSIRTEILALATQTTARSVVTTLWSAVLAGWMIALVAWLVSSTTSSSAQFLVTWVLTYLVGLAGFAHSIASSTEILTAVWAGAIGLGSYAGWLLGAVAGNVVGGVLAVSVLNYGQVAPESRREEPDAR